MDKEILEKIYAHLERLEKDQELIKKDIIANRDGRLKSLEYQLTLNRGAIVGIKHVLNIINYGDAYWIS